MRTAIITPSALLLVALGSGCGTPTAGAAERSIDDPVYGVAGDCPTGTESMRAAGAGAAVDRNHDGYVCVRRRVSISGDSLLFEVDNDTPSAGSDAVWGALYNGM